MSTCVHGFRVHDSSHEEDGTCIGLEVNERGEWTKQQDACFLLAYN